MYCAILEEVQARVALTMTVLQAGQGQMAGPAEERHGARLLVEQGRRAVRTDLRVGQGGPAALRLSRAGCAVISSGR